MRDLDRTYLPGEPVLWRQESTSRTWNDAFAIGRDNQWVLVRLASGDEIRVHPKNVKPKKGK
jgi:hypothetical protein